MFNEPSARALGMRKWGTLRSCFRVFVSYCVSLTKRATLQSSVIGSNLIGLKTIEISGSETLES